MNKNQSPDEAPEQALEENLNSLVTKLLAESWARNSNLGEFTMDQLGRSLEDARESFEQADDDSADFLREKASFERCVEIYCSILLWVETKGCALPTEPLEALSGSPKKKIAARKTSPPTPPPKREIIPSFEAEGNDELDLSIPPMAQESSPETSSETSPEISKAQEVNDLWSAMTAKAPEANAEKEANAEETAVAALPSVDTEAPKRSIESVEDLPEWNPSNATPIAMPQLSVSDAPAESEETWEEKPLAAAGQAMHEETQTPHALTNKRAREYWQLYEYFRSLESTWPLEKGQLTKLIAQSVCFSLEAEFIERLEPALKTFWAQREAPIRHLLDQGNRKFELHPSLKKAVNQAAEEHTEWLLEGKFPHAAVLTSLRYMLATLQPEKFQPSLLEAGILLYFFGQQIKLGEFSLQNLLHVGGVTADQLREMMFRLSRLHRLRAKILGATTDLETSQLAILVGDARALLTLLESIHVGEHFADRKAA